MSDVDISPEAVERRAKALDTGTHYVLNVEIPTQGREHKETAAMLRALAAALAEAQAALEMASDMERRELTNAEWNVMRAWEMCDSERARRERAEAALRQCMSVMPAFPDYGYHIVGLRASYDAAITEAARILAQEPTP
jgi:hypothetical protein